MSNCLGLYIEENLIKYAKVSKDHDNLKVESFGEAGEDFDPNIHNAIAHKESSEEKQNFISLVYQKGYKMGERIIRHAMVEVTN